MVGFMLVKLWNDSEALVEGSESWAHVSEALGEGSESLDLGYGNRIGARSGSAGLNNTGKPNHQGTRPSIIGFLCQKQ